MIGDRIFLRKLKWCGASMLTLAVMISSCIGALSDVLPLPTPDLRTMNEQAVLLAHSSVNDLLAQAVVWLVVAFLGQTVVLLWIVLKGPVAKMMQLQTESLVLNERLLRAIGYCQIHSGAYEAEQRVMEAKRREGEPV